MKTLFLDVETYYDKEYSLKKMTPAEYILDDRFELICMAGAVDDAPVEFIDGPECKAWLGQFDPKQTITVTYNALFDNCVLAWRLGFIPWQLLDALGMARALLGHRLRSLSLDTVVKHLGVGEKGHEIKSALGLRRRDLMADPAVWAAYRRYNINDTHLLREVYHRLYREFPQCELPIMDLVLRCAVQPRLLADFGMLEEHYNDIREAKKELVDRAQIAGATYQDQKDGVMSNETFKEALTARGVGIEYKHGKLGLIPAFAKTDDFMVGLQESEDPVVQALAAARLGLKSTLEETRTLRLMKIASLPWWTAGVAPDSMPIPLRYAGAHTNRLSGDWKINMQNLPTSRSGKAILRKALKAPPGYKVLVGDLAQIEARLTAWFCGATPLLQQFINKEDPYGLLASKIFKRPIDRKGKDVVEGQIGKAGILGLGFGAGATKFYSMVIRQARSANMDIGALLEIWTPELAEQSKNTYRAEFYQIPQMWRLLDQVLASNWSGKVASPLNIGPVSIGHRDGYGYVAGPGFREMRYEKPSRDDGELWYWYGGRMHKIYGAAFLENIIQFLARHIQMNAAVWMSVYGYRMVHTVHDELIFVVPENDVDAAAKMLHMFMTRCPKWAPDLPLAADVNWGDSYGDAK